MYREASNPAFITEFKCVKLVDKSKNLLISAIYLIFIKRYQSWLDAGFYSWELNLKCKNACKYSTTLCSYNCTMYMQEKQSETFCNGIFFNFSSSHCLH